MGNNRNLHKANLEKKDEYYTKMNNIEKELNYYTHYFKNKIVFCNCDDPEYSNFWKYFEINFKKLKLKKLIATHYEEVKTSYKLELILNKKELSTIKSPLTQNGDFRSSECIEILKEADIVVTNPPFSLFREYIAQLMEYQKDFIVIGSQNALTYKELFPLFKKNKMWIGYNSGAQEFRVPDTYERNNIYIGVDGYKYAKFGNITWYTNLEISKRHEIVPLYKKYNALEYPKYDDYDAINVSKISEIPYDYKGKMGVPVTILEKFNPDQFELIGIDRYLKDNPQYGRRFKINGKEIYARIVIKNKKVK
ncbi:MAG: modification methylase [Bacilli bacterium]|nr:modification methylase [Bacilli bacterium]